VIRRRLREAVARKPRKLKPSAHRLAIACSLGRFSKNPAISI
jgi:hypothetical protein